MCILEHLADQVVLRRPEGGQNIWFGPATYTFRATGRSTNGSLTVLEASVPPGGGPPPHVHRETDESFFVRSGSVEFLNGTETLVAQPGDYLFVPRGVRHRFQVVGTRTAELTILFTPGGMDEYFTAIGVPAVPGEVPGPMDPVRARLITELAPRHDVHFDAPD